MIISFTNVIGAIRSLGEAAQVITTNLKMWLGFETSETLGREEVVNGDFATDSNWNKQSNWTISGGQAVSNGSSGYIKQNNVVTNNKTYQIVFSTEVTSGRFRAVTTSDASTYTPYITGSGTYTFYMSPTSSLAGGFEFISDAFDGSISNVSVRELTQITPDKSGNNNVGELFTGKALEFDGVNDRVVIDFTTQIKSAVFWVKPLGTGEESILGFGGVATVAKSIKSDSNNIQSAGLSSVSVYVNGVSTTSVPVNQWSRVVVNFALFTPQTLEFGYAYNSLGNIQLSDVQLYNENLSTDDIAYDYANPNKLAIDNPSTSLSVTNLKGYWALSEGDGFVAYDSSGEGNNGTINGATYVDAQPRIPQLGMMNWSKGSNLFPYSEDFTEWVISASTSQVFLAPTEEAPYGQGDVYSIIMQSSESDAYIRYATNNATLTSSTHSVWVKQSPTGSATHIRITNNNKAAWNTGTSKKIALTSSWQRIETTDAITGNRFTIIGSADASGTQDSDCIGKALIYGAQLVEGSSAGAYRFTDGAAISNSTFIANLTTPTQDILGNAVRDRLNSFNLDGIGYAEVVDADSLDFGTGDFTLECWAKYDFLNQGSGWNVLVSNGSISSSGGSGFSIASSSSSFSVRLNAGTAVTKSFGTDNMTVGNWYHLVVTREGTTLKAYRDTSLKSSSTIISVDVDTSLPVKIGRDTKSDRFYQNLISDVRLYKGKALSATEVENNYNAGLSAHRN